MTTKTRGIGSSPSRRSRGGRLARSLVAALALVVVGTAPVDAAVSDYAFTEGTTTFTSISGTGTQLLSPSVDDVASAVTPIGFTFTLDGTDYTQFSASSNGPLGLGAAQVTSQFGNNLTGSSTYPIIAAWWDDLYISDPQHGTWFEVSGAAPNRVLTVEWNTRDFGGQGTTSYEFQVRLHEGTNRIEFVYGPSTLDGLESASIGVATSGANFASITPGSPATVSNAVANNSVSAFPSDGTSYTLSLPAGTANGFLSPTLVRAPLGGAPGTLSVAATLDLGDKTVDFSDPTSITFGSTMLDLPDGLTPNRRGTVWSWISADRLTRVTIVPPNKRNGTSRARFSLVVRNWSDLLPAYPGGVGEALDIGLACGAFSVGCNVQLVAGGIQHRLNTQLADAPALTLDRVAGFLRGAHTPRVAITASFAGDGVVPGAPPTVTLSLGEPGSTYDVTVPTVDHVTTATPTGWQFAIPDPDGTGPLLPQGTWFVDVDYVHRRVSVFVRGENFGTFPRGTVPFLFGLDLGGGAHAVQVCASQRSNRLSYR